MARLDLAVRIIAHASWHPLPAEDICAVVTQPQLVLSLMILLIFDAGIKLDDLSSWSSSSEVSSTARPISD